MLIWAAVPPKSTSNSPNLIPIPRWLVTRLLERLI
jgi:hypothetical protein